MALLQTLHFMQCHSPFGPAAHLAATGRLAVGERGVGKRDHPPSSGY